MNDSHAVCRKEILEAWEAAIKGTRINSVIMRTEQGYRKLHITRVTYSSSGFDIEVSD